MRAVAIGDRTLEIQYDDFVFSQARRGAEEASRLALAVAYGRDARGADLAGRPARVYELGPEPPPDDIDGRMPAVVAWADGDLFCLIASGTFSSAELVMIALSLYGSKSKVQSAPTRRDC